MGSLHLPPAMPKDATPDPKMSSFPLLVCTHSDEEVRRSYRKAALKYHPDKALSVCKFTMEFPGGGGGGLGALSRAGSIASAAGGGGSFNGQAGGGIGSFSSFAGGGVGPSSLSSPQLSGCGSLLSPSLKLSGTADMETRLREEAALLFNFINQVRGWRGGVGRKRYAGRR